MRFNKHSRIEGSHAFLSASKYHWIDYPAEKLDASFMAAIAAKRGNDLHDYAQRAITLGIKQADIEKTLNMYINDAIGYGMTPEQPLFYSDNCFGTTDAIGFRDKYLRIHDYKSGITTASFKQLRVYAAMFCLEYNVKPVDITTELRLYQNDKIVGEIAEPMEIARIMDVIVNSDIRIEEMRREIVS